MHHWWLCVHPVSADSLFSGLGLGAVVGLGLAGLLLLLVLVDVSCFFLRQCGLLMCITRKLCSKKTATSGKSKELEEGKAAYLWVSLLHQLCMYLTCFYPKRLKNKAQYFYKQQDIIYRIIFLNKLIYFMTNSVEFVCLRNDKNVKCTGTWYTVSCDFNSHLNISTEIQYTVYGLYAIAYEDKKIYISKFKKKLTIIWHWTLYTVHWKKIISVEIIFTQKLLVNSTHNYKETAASYTLSLL